MSRCKYKIENKGEICEVILSGVIDDSFPTDKLVLPAEKIVEINLNEIKMINSLGIREWIKFVNSVQSKNVSITYCPKIFIDQVNMVQGFIPAEFKIKSFYVPYFNEDDDLEKSVLYVSGEDYGDGFLNVKSTINHDSGAVLDIDVMEQKYFKFLKV